MQSRSVRQLSGKREMIWNIRELKKKARVQLKNCYWLAVAVCLLTTMLTGWIGSAGIGLGMIQSKSENAGAEMSQQRIEELKHDIKERNPIAEYKISIVQQQLDLLIFVFALAASAMIVVLGTLVIICIGNPIKVSSKRFFMCNRKRKTNVGMILYVFRNHYTAHVTAVMFQKGLYVLGSTLLLIVPGIIKHYEYYMVPYILAENPTMTCRRAMELSSKMTEGQKMDMLKMDLSFWFWQAAGIFSFGIVSVFYTMPYKEFTKAELYHVMRQNMLADQVCDHRELPGFETDLGV